MLWVNQSCQYPLDFLFTKICAVYAFGRFQCTFCITNEYLSNDTRVSTVFKLYSRPEGNGIKK